MLPSLGWHLDWRLQSLAGKNGATVIVAVILTAMVGAILLTEARNRPFAVTAVLTGFVFCLFGTTLTAHIATAVMSPDNESGARYTALPIFLIECVAVVGVDYVLRQRASARSDARAAHGGAHRRPGIALRSVMAVLAVVVVLSASWVFDFRYAGWRSFASWGLGTDRGELGARLPAVDVGRDQRGAARPHPVHLPLRPDTSLAFNAK